MNFGEALEKMKTGKSVAREGWDDRSIAIFHPGANAPMTEPYIYVVKGDKKEPYTFSHADVMAENWT